MKVRSFIYFAALTSLTPLLGQEINEKAPSNSFTHLINQPSKEFRSISPFYGKVTRSRVRLRLRPSTDSTIVRELDQGEILRIMGEDSQFYAVEPPDSIKGYVYKTYVLDGVIDGARVNIRVSPHLEAPILGQIKEGTKVDGTVAPQSHKWLEISLKEHALFYVAKEFIEKTEPPTTDISAPVTSKDPLQTNLPISRTERMEYWAREEQKVYDEWLNRALIDPESNPLTIFYLQEKERREVLKGTLELFDSPVANKPGDFILRGENGITLAYLYSPDIDLRAFIGKKVELKGSPRNNNKFAYPAYCVLKVRTLPN